ncbi:hypothetical protein H0A71_15545 [Alcaligenaceae bacterium]|nr:hypothetical protein [Alcaligenaceae bacterium]
MTKRNLFAELTEGFEALKNTRESKVTLRQHIVEAARSRSNGTESLTRKEKAHRKNHGALK